MWRWKSIMAALLLICFDLTAQESDSFAAISEFTGAVSAEEMDNEEVERLEKFLSRPLKINMSNTSRLLESGLLTTYQMASLVDYRTRHGDILSLTELAAVDGFGHDFVRKIAPFISLETARMPGQRTRNPRKTSMELDIKGGLRAMDNLKDQYALRYRIEYGECIQGGIALSKAAESSRLDAISANIFWSSDRHPLKLAAGDFNARFGQGLALWNGMSISSVNKPSSYLKRASGISPSYSFTGNYAFRGVAAETFAGRSRLSMMAAFTESGKNKGILPAINLSWLWRGGQAGLTHYAGFQWPSGVLSIPDMKTSCDIACTLRGVDLFAEASYDWISCALASVAGTVFPAGENLRMAVMLRYYPPTYSSAYSAASRALTRCSNEYGMSMSAEFAGGRWINVSGKDGAGASSRRLEGAICADAAYFPVPKDQSGVRSIQMKCLAEFKIMLSEELSLHLRASERFRTWGNLSRADIRADILYYSRLCDLCFRANIVKSENVGFLSFAEAAVRSKTLKFTLKSGIFFVDDWDDRIYSYERDIPGSFNVPAFYGRGCWGSFTASWQYARWGRAYIRAGITDYPFMKEKKPGKAELKLMLRFQI